MNIFKTFLVFGMLGMVQPKEASMPSGYPVAAVEVAKLFRSGMGPDEIARTLGICRATISPKLVEVGIRQRNRTPLTEDEKADIIRTGLADGLFDAELQWNFL